MGDSIDRKTAIDAVSSMFAPTPTQKDMVEDCLEILENLPAVQPQQIVRCKDCKYWMRENISDGYCSEMNVGDCDEDFYCGYERKENR